MRFALHMADLWSIPGIPCALLNTGKCSECGTRSNPEHQWM